MQKLKHKIEQQTLWQRFFDDYIVTQSDFYYTIERDPEKIIETFRKYWVRQRWHWYSLDFKLDVKKNQELWSLELTDGLYNSKGQREIEAKIIVEIYHEDARTIVSGSISNHEQALRSLKQISFYGLLLALPFILVALLTGTLVFVLLLILPFSFMIEGMKRNSRIKQKQLLEFFEVFVSHEEEKLEAELERLFGKAKNEEGKIKHSEESDEIPQANRK